MSRAKLFGGFGSYKKDLYRREGKGLVIVWSCVNQIIHFSKASISPSVPFFNHPFLQIILTINLQLVRTRRHSLAGFLLLTYSPCYLAYTVLQFFCSSFLSCANYHAYSILLVETLNFGHRYMYIVYIVQEYKFFPKFFISQLYIFNVRIRKLEPCFANFYI